MRSRIVQLLGVMVLCMALAVPCFATATLEPDYATAASTVSGSAASALAASWPIFAGIVAAMIGLRFLKRVVKGGS